MKYINIVWFTIIEIEIKMIILIISIKTVKWLEFILYKKKYNNNNILQANYGFYNKGNEMEDYLNCYHFIKLNIIIPIIIIIISFFYLKCMRFHHF